MHVWLVIFHKLERIVEIFMERIEFVPWPLAKVQIMRDRMEPLSTILVDLFQSLVLAASLGFIVPVMGIGILLLSISIWMYVPIVGGIATATVQQILMFLSVFGNGYPIRGALAIGLACSFVCTLFDAFVFYQYRNVRREG